MTSGITAYKTNIVKMTKKTCLRSKSITEANKKLETQEREGAG